MALIVDWSDNRFNVPAPQSYTRVTDVKVFRQTTYNTPLTPDAVPTIRGTHSIQFRTETFIDKASADAGNAPIEEHGYYVPSTFEAKDIYTVCYEYLVREIARFKNATYA